MPKELTEALLSVWRQAMAESAKVVVLDGKSYPVRRTAHSVTCGRWISLLTALKSAGWSKIQKRNRAGRNWRVPGRK
jgi:hypothetical protein